MECLFGFNDWQSTLFDSFANVHDRSRSSVVPCSLLLRLALPSDEGLAVARSNAHIGEDLRRSQLNGGDVLGLVGDLLLEFLPERVSPGGFHARPGGIGW